jgi:hypothetical protein
VVTSARQSVAVLLAAAALASGYVLSLKLGAPMVWLDSKLLVFSFGERPSPEAMDFFGRSLWGLLAAALAAGGALLSRPGARGVRVVTVLTAAVMAGCLGLEAVRVMNRVPVASEEAGAPGVVAATAASGRLVEEL